MLAWVADAPAWVWPLGFGALCAALWLAAAYGFTALARWLGRRPERALRSLSAWRLGRWAGAVGAAIALDAALIGCLFATSDVGLGVPDWAATLQWLPTVAGVMALWLALLWGAAWWRYPARASLLHNLGWGSAGDLPAYLIFHEASLAFLRGALGSALGAYWGAWSAIVVKGGLALLAPGSLAALREGPRRPWALLTISLDWLSTAVLVASGSLWPGLAARLLGFLAVLIAYGFVRRIAPQTETGCPPPAGNQPE